MKKGPVIGLTAAVLVLSVIIGIASLPDEVLIDSSAIENTQATKEEIPIVPTLEESHALISNSNEQIKFDDTKAELDALKKEMSDLKNDLVELKTDSKVPDETPAVKVEDVSHKVDSQEESEGKVIKVNMQDGVGAKQR